MYIPDDEWDEIVSMALELSEAYDVVASGNLTSFMNSIINLEDKPVPRKKRAPSNSFKKIRKGRDLMRKFSKYFVLRYAQKHINKIRSRKRKPNNLTKSA